REGREEERQEQLDERDDLEQQEAKPGRLAEGGVAREPDGRLPGGDAEDAEQPDEGGPGGVVPGPTGNGHQLPHEDRAEQARTPLLGARPFRPHTTNDAPKSGQDGRAPRKVPLAYSRPPRLVESVHHASRRVQPERVPGRVAGGLRKRVGRDPEPRPARRRSPRLRPAPERPTAPGRRPASL